MDRIFVTRALALYLPILGSLALILWRKPSGRVTTGAFVAFVWNLVWLIPFGRVATSVGWFSFAEDVPSFLGMPVDLWLGWAVLWGALPILSSPSHPWIAAIAIVWMDLALMPLLNPVVSLSESWIVGQIAGVAVCLVPAVFLGMWTAKDQKLVARCCLQVTAFAALVLGLIPWAVIEGKGLDLSAVLDWPFLVKGIALAIFALPLVIGASAAQEFATRGGGTPLPLDPPKRLVTSGPYAYVANPMQMSVTLALAILSIIIKDTGFAMGAGAALIFSAGIAGWNEDTQLRARFGEEWSWYRARVRAWIPRWKPLHSELQSQGLVGTLYFAATCDQCSFVGEWIRRRHPLALVLLAAENSPVPLRRLTYLTPDGSVETGVAAFGRALEHVNLAWALVGWLIRLPLLNQMIQLIVDASGGGPRDIQQRSCAVGDQSRVT